MRIVSAFSNLKELRYLMKNGCDEVYCGMLANGGIGRNHRPNKKEFNISGIKELRKAIILAHRHGSKISIAINEVGYNKETLKSSLEFIDNASSLGADSFIVSDIGLMDIISRYPKQKLNANLTLSSVVPCFNPESVNFFRKFGIKRIILSQHLFPAEAGFLKNLGLETEVFFLKSNYCRNIDGFCFYEYNNHMWSQEMPMEPCNHVTSALKNSRLDPGALFRYHFPPGLDPYGAVYDYYQQGVDYLKLGSRESGFEEKKKYFLVAKAILKLLKKEKNRRKFILKSRLIAARTGLL